MMLLGCAVATVWTFATAVAAGVGPVATEGSSVPYGVVAHLSRSEYGQHEALLDLAKAAGIDYVRVDWDWRICQPTKDGGFDFCKYDRLVDAAESRGIRILPIIYDAPKWASPA